MMEERPEPNFTLDELAQEMAQNALEILGEIRRKKCRHNDPGFSAKEWAALWGVHRRTAAERIEELDGAGLIIEGKRTITDKRGHTQHIPVYRLKENEEKGGETDD